MTFEAAYVKTEVLPPTTEEFSPACDGGGGSTDDSVAVKREMIFIPESVGMKLEDEEEGKEEEEEQEEEEEEEEEGSLKDAEDKEYVHIGVDVCENASSPDSWSFRLLEVTHETDCADRTSPAPHRHVIYPDRCVTPGSPRRDRDERDPFATEPESGPLDGGKRSAERFGCAHCGKTFFSRYCITKHVFTHEPGVPAPASICELCGDVFPDAAALSRHVAARDHDCEDGTRGRNAADVPQLVSRRAELPPVSRIRPFACRACGATFARMSHLKVHEAIHAGDRPHACDVCGKRFRQSVHLKIHKRLHSDERPYGCEVCGKAFRQSVHLQIHLRLHTGYRPFSCDVCGRTFTDRTGLNRHKAVHSRDHPFGCEICGRSFPDEGGLREHRSRNNCVAGPFPCDKCGKSFPDPFALNRHVRVHEGKKRKPCDVCGDGSPGGRVCRHDKPYVCKVCGKNFARSSSLKRHVAIHAVGKTFECEDCRRRFKWESSLATHKCEPDTSPKQFSCDICGKVFRFKHNAEAHRKVHTGESTFSCDVCGKLCNSASNLRSHYKVHSEERPYACETCGKSFRRSGNLVAHRKTHLFGGHDCRFCPMSFNTSTALVRHIQHRHAVSPPVAPPLPDGNVALLYECSVCRSSFTDTVSYWRHVAEHSGNSTALPDSHYGGDRTVYTTPPYTNGIDVLGHNTHPINSDLTCESELIIPVSPEIVNMY